MLCTDLHGPSPPGFPLPVLRTAVAGTPLSVGRASAHTEKSQKKNMSHQEILQCPRELGWKSWCDTLLPSTVWNFFSKHFLALASSLYVMKINPLLFFDLGSSGRSMFSIYIETIIKSDPFMERKQELHDWVFVKSVTLTSPNAPKYSLMVSSVASGFNPPTKIFLTGSFFMAIALLGSIKRPSSLCSFCCSTWGLRQVIINQSESEKSNPETEKKSEVLPSSKSRGTYSTCYIFCKIIWRWCTCLFHTGWVFEEDKAKTSRPAAIRVKLDGAIRHITEFAKVVL